MKGITMTGEPASSVAAGAVGWKLIGGGAGALGAGAALATIVVMLMTPPRSAREWAVGLICTVIGSVAGGAFVIDHFKLQQMMDSFTGLLSVLGLAFACGLPAWAVVRWIFTYIERRDASKIDILQAVKEVKEAL